MIVSRRAVPGLALCTALVTVATLYYGAIGEVPRTFFGGEETFLVAPAGGRLVGTASVPQALVGPLASLDEVRAASPEVYVATSIDGRSVMARGVDFGAFLSLENGRLARGQMPDGPGEALAGVGFAEAFGLEPNDIIVLPGSLARTASRIVVTGFADVDGPAREELLIQLDDARALAALRPGEVHLIRVATDERPRVKALVESVAPTFTYSDVEFPVGRLLPGQPATLRANLTNWGRIDAIKVAQLRLDGISIAERAYRVGSFETVPVQLNFTIRQAGRYNLTLNPTAIVEVGEGTVVFSQAPALVVAGERFTVRVREAGGAPMAGALIEAENVSVTTDAQGFATLSLVAPGRTFLRATREVARGEVGVHELYVADARFARTSSGFVAQFLLPSLEVGNARPVSLQVDLENRGGQRGPVSVPLLLGNSTVAYANATLEAGATRSVAVGLAPLALGNYTLRAANGTATVRFRVIEGEDPRIEALLRGYDERGTRTRFAAATGDTADEYVERTVGNIGAAVLILSLASAALASVAAIAMLQRHLMQEKRSLGVLKSVGASDRYVLELVGWETARQAALASALGVAVGVVVALLIDSTGLVRAFGHAVHPYLDWTTLGLILLLSILTLALAARALAKQIIAAPPDALLRDETEEGRRA